MHIINPAIHLEIPRMHQKTLTVMEKYQQKRKFSFEAIA